MRLFSAVRRTLLMIAVIVLFVPPARAEDDLTRDMANLKQLLAEIQKELPEGWRSELVLDVPETIACEFRRPDAQGIMIWRQDKTIGRYVGLKLAPGSTDAEFQSMRIFFQMSLMSLITPQQYREAAVKNADSDRKRHEFQHKLKEAGIKNSIAFLIKDDEPPLPPSSYKPQSREQKELIRQYGLLWAETEPRALPTHFYRTLAFQVDFDEHFNSQDGEIDSERQEVKKAILKLLTAYGGEAGK